MFIIITNVPAIKIFAFCREEAASHNSNALLASGEGCEDTQQIQIPTTPISPHSPVSCDSPRKRRTGLHVVNQKPEISPELVQEHESRMRAAQASASATSNTPPPKTSPSKPGSLLKRRTGTGLSTVMEVKSLHCDSPFITSPDPAGRSQSSDPFRCILTASNDASTCDAIRVMQEEAAAARLAQNEGASSADSASSGYMSPHFLRPPSPSDDLMQPRRSSDSGVDLPGHEVSCLKNSASAPSKPIQQLYDEMYMDPASPNVILNNSRRYSYPNSPVHNQLTSSASTASTLAHVNATHDLRIPQSAQLTNHLQQLRLQQYKIDEESSLVPSTTLAAAVSPSSGAARPVSHKWKGSITQGVPSRPPTTSPTPSLLTPSLEGPYPSSMAHSHSFDDAYEHTLKPRGISGSASSVWYSSAMEDTEVDYISLPYVPMSPTSAPPISFPATNTAPSDHPEICVTNVTGDQIKFVFGTAATVANCSNLDPNHLPPQHQQQQHYRHHQQSEAEPMDHS